MIEKKWQSVFSGNPLTKMFVILLVVNFLSSCGSSSEKETVEAVIPTPSLTVTPASIAVDALENTVQVNISATQSWAATTSAAWVSMSQASGTGSSDLSLSITANENAAVRSAEITVTSGTLASLISISQEGGEIQEGGQNSFSYDVPPDNTGMRDIDSTEFTGLMGVGFNIGNTLDAIGGETAWGNPKITPELIDAIKTAGFTAIRLPVAWSQFTDEENFTIDPLWLARVDEVVRYAVEQDLYVMMNIHWDEGWMQPTYAEQDYVNNRLAIMWQQIAEYFRNYDDSLLFAGTNEVMVTGDYGTPTEEYYTVQNSFNQTFVTAVRKTGGRNAYRQLIVQGFNTNIDHTVNFATIPEDVIDNRLMMEVHFYDPYDFTLNENSSITQWGNMATDISKTTPDRNEAYVDSQFMKMRTNYHDQGIGVILGEYGVIARTDVADHEQYRIYWNDYITHAAVDHHLVPFYWDNGYTTNHSFGLFNRATASPVYTGLIEAITNSN